MLTHQEIFDTVANHLMAQHAKSLSRGQCAYRAAGLTCAIGCLIPERIDVECIEGNDVVAAFELAPTLFAGLGIGEEHLPMLNALQGTHDAVELYRWPARLQEIAAAYNLTVPSSVVAYLDDRRRWVDLLEGRHRETAEMILQLEKCKSL